MLSYRSLRTHRLRCVACVTLHTNRVSLMHSVVCIVYVERYVQTIHIPVDTPASEVFSRPSTQICPCWGVGGVLLGHVARVITYETRTPSRGATSTSGTHRSPHPSSPCRRICLCRNRVCLGYYIGPRAGAESGGCRGRKIN